MGLVIAIFAVFNIFVSKWLPINSPSYIIGIIIFVVIGYLMIKVPINNAKKHEE